MRTYYVGIDVSKDELVVCVIDADKQVRYQASFENTKAGHRTLSNYLKKRKVIASGVCLEATGAYGDEIASYLHERDYAVSVVNPLRIKRYGESQLKRNKTDRLDAEVIADFCRTQSPELWTPPSASWLELRALSRHLEALTATRTQEKLRLDTTTSPRVKTSLKRHIRHLDNQIETIKQQIQDHIDGNPDLKADQELLNSIPGIADLTSSRLLAEIRDITAFDSVEQLIAYCGLNPQLKQSGKYRGETKISKVGNARIRAALYLPAQTAKRRNALVQPLVARLEAAGLCSRSITVVIMRKLLHFAYGILKSRQPFDPDYLLKQAAAA